MRLARLTFERALSAQAAYWRHGEFLSKPYGDVVARAVRRDAGFMRAPACSALNVKTSSAPAKRPPVESERDVTIATLGTRSGTAAGPYARRGIARGRERVSASAEVGALLGRGCAAGHRTWSALRRRAPR